MSPNENFAQNCCTLKDFFAVVYNPDSGKSYTFNTDVLVDYEVMTSISLSVNGILIVEDPYDVSSIIDSNKNLWIHIFYLEYDNKTYLRKDFRVLNASKKIEENKAYLRFELLDSLSYILSKTYVPSDQLSLGACIKEYYSEYYEGDKEWKNPTIDGVPNFRENYTIDVKSDSNEIFSIPSNKSFLSAFTDELNRNGFICYQENGVIRLCSIKDISKLQVLDICKFQKYDQNYSDATTYLYFSKFFEGSKTEQLPTSINYSIDYNNKKIKIQEQNVKDVSTKIKQDTSGFNLVYSETATTEKFTKSTYFNFLNNFGGYIVVPARKAQIAILNIINVEAHNPGSNSQIDKAGDIKYSGAFIVSGYTNKIVNRNRLVTLAKICRFST